MYAISDPNADRHRMSKICWFKRVRAARLAFSMRGHQRLMWGAVVSKSGMSLKQAA
jgi:hypothetical protein